MKLFTVKDFIAYNAPCFSCGGKIILKGTSGNGFDTLKPTVEKEHTVLDLKTMYHYHLQLRINHKTNQVISNDIRGCAEYLLDKKISLRSICERCYTSFDSHFLTININKGYVEPFGISKERLHVTDDHNMYDVQSSYIDEKTRIIVDRIDKTNPISPIIINDMPLITLSKVKTKERLIAKLKTYITFS